MQRSVRLYSVAMLVHCTHAFMGPITTLQGVVRRPKTVTGALVGNDFRHVQNKVSLGDMPEDLKLQLAENKMNETRLFSKTMPAHRAEMRRQAEQSSKLACSIYFESIKRRSYLHHRLHRDRQTFGKAETAVYSQNTQVFRLPMSALSSISAYSPARRPYQEEITVMSAEDTAFSVRTALLSIAIDNRVDSTKHEGIEYMDVVMELNKGETVPRGVVLQITDDTCSKGYLEYKARALRQDGWEVLQIKVSRWERRSSEQRLEYLHANMSKIGVLDIGRHKAPSQ